MGCISLRQLWYHRGRRVCLARSELSGGDTSGSVEPSRRTGGEKEIHVKLPQLLSRVHYISA